MGNHAHRRARMGGRWRHRLRPDRAVRRAGEGVVTSDMGEMFNDWRAAKQQKKRENLASSTDILTQRGIRFESKNGGVHLIVYAGERVVDFWPSTGKWIVRGGRTGRGVFKLLKHIAP